MNKETPIENELLSKQLEKDFDEMIHTGVDEDDPHWKLFDINNQVNDAVLNAYNTGWKQGYRKGWLQAGSDLIMYKVKFEKLQPYITKINGWANFLHEVKSHFSNIAKR